jgi:tetraacyldisaccharide 4'-kinase
MLETFWKKVVRRRRLSWLIIPAFLFWLASFFYRLGFRIYRATRGEPVDVSLPVISVGNISVGGTGKTPLVSLIAEHLQHEGIRVGIVSSGYGRRSREPVLMPGYKLQNLDVATTGDEILLLSRQLPEAIFAIDESKTTAAQKLATTGDIDVIILDDGFQHFTLARDLDIVTYDAALKRQWLKMFPYGVLREPLSALARADIIVITRARFAKDIRRLRKRLARRSPTATIYHAGFVPEKLCGRQQEMSVKYLEDKSVFLFAGVGNFRALQKQVMALSADLDHALELSDHQEYDRALLEKITRQADKYDSDVILTTGKDWMKLGDFDFGREIYYLQNSIDLDPGEEKLVRQIMEELDLKPPER